MCLRNVSSHGRTSYKKKKKNRTPCTPSESTDEPKQPGDGEEDQESPTEQDESSDEELQPTQEQLESVTKIDAAHIKKTGKELGRGSQAVVFEGLWGNVKVALKECVVPTESDASYIQDCICQEVALHFRLRHPNILTLYGISTVSTTVTLVTEQLDKSLGHIMDSQEQLTDVEKTYIGQQAAEGLAFLHATSIVHGDIKPVNILLDKTRRVVKLCDMGLSRVKENLKATRTMSMRGTVPFMSPAVLVKNHRSSFPCDVWALGGTLVELYANNDLWEVPAKRGQTLQKVMTKKMKAHAEPDGLLALKSMDNLLYDAVAPCLAYEVSARPTARDFADHLTQLLEAMEKQKEALDKDSE